MDEHAATRARVAALPAEWYAAQPIPERLLMALASPRSYSQYECGVARQIVRELYPAAAKRSTVEQAHTRATNRLLRGKK